MSPFLRSVELLYKLSCDVKERNIRIQRKADKDITKNWLVIKIEDFFGYHKSLKQEGCIITLFRKGKCTLYILCPDGSFTSLHELNS